MIKSSSLLLLVFISTFVFLTGCKDDDPPARDKFLGAYAAVETCGSGNDNYDITIIESGTNENAVIVINLYDFGAQLSASVSGDNITIANQTISGITYSGNGSINNDILTLNFSLSDATASDNCVATCTRK